MEFPIKSSLMGLLNQHPYTYRCHTFSLVYKYEVILTIEVEIPSLRVSLESVVNNEEYWVFRLNELELLDERFLSALNHLQVYQNWIKQSYNKKIKNINF